MLSLAIEHLRCRRPVESVADFEVERRAFLLVPGFEDAVDQIVLQQGAEGPADQRLAPLVEGSFGRILAIDGNEHQRAVALFPLGAGQRQPESAGQCGVAGVARLLHGTACFRD